MTFKTKRLGQEHFAILHFVRTVVYHVVFKTFFIASILLIQLLLLLAILNLIVIDKAGKIGILISGTLIQKNFLLIACAGLLAKLQIMLVPTKND